MNTNTKMLQDLSDRIILDNVKKDPSYAPYCIPCPGLKRMVKVEFLYWKCSCGTQCDLRTHECGHKRGHEVDDCPCCGR